MTGESGVVCVHTGDTAKLLNPKKIVLAIHELVQFHSLDLQALAGTQKSPVRPYGRPADETTVISFYCHPAPYPPVITSQSPTIRSLAHVFALQLESHSVVNRIPDLGADCVHWICMRSHAGRWVTSGKPAAYPIAYITATTSFGYQTNVAHYTRHAHQTHNLRSPFVVSKRTSSSTNGMPLSSRLAAMCCRPRSMNPNWRAPAPKKEGTRLKATATASPRAAAASAACCGQRC